MSAKGQLLRARPSSLPEPQQLSQPSHRLPSAFSFERLMGFTLLSDTCWKCNCAHNCYEEKEAALSPSAGALGKERARPRSLSCILAAGALPWAPSWVQGTCPEDRPGKEQIPVEAFRFPEPKSWHGVRGGDGAMSSH